jgi:hypothetical protein
VISVEQELVIGSFVDTDESHDSPVNITPSNTTEKAPVFKNPNFVVRFSLRYMYMLAFCIVLLNDGYMYAFYKEIQITIRINRHITYTFVLGC